MCPISTVSFSGRFGRTALIEIAGAGSSDETVGTVTQDIPRGAIQEFQPGQSMLDLSTELTSSGVVDVVTKSGTNTFHGSGSVESLAFGSRNGGRRLRTADI